MSEERERKSHALAWTLWVLAAQLLYVLSLGPVDFLTEKELVPGPVVPWIETFYTPVFWLRSHTPLGELLTPYLEWWTRL